jgi:hypothetical protein
MQHNRLHHEYARALEQERARAARLPRHRNAHSPPPPRGVRRRRTRRRAAQALARLAWRLDREAALRAWP